MKVIIAGGGTGGHLYPGIALAREFLRERGNEVLFVGTKQGIEAKVLPNVPLSEIKVMGQRNPGGTTVLVLGGGLILLFRKEKHDQGNGRGRA